MKKVCYEKRMFAFIFIFSGIAYTNLGYDQTSLQAMFNLITSPDMIIRIRFKLGFVVSWSIQIGVLVQ